MNASMVVLGVWLLSMAPVAALAAAVGIDLQVDTQRVVKADSQATARALQALQQAITRDPIFSHWVFSGSPAPDGLVLVLHIPASGEEVGYAKIGVRLERRRGGRQDRILRRSSSVFLWRAEDYSRAGSLEKDQLVQRIRAVFEEAFLPPAEHGMELLRWLREEVPIGEAAWDARADQDVPLVVTSIPKERVDEHEAMRWAMVVITGQSARGQETLCAIGVGTIGEGQTEGGGGRGRSIRGLNFRPQELRLGLQKEDIQKGFDRTRIPRLEFVYLHHIRAMGLPQRCFWDNR